MDPGQIELLRELWSTIQTIIYIFNEIELLQNIIRDLQEDVRRSREEKVSLLQQKAQLAQTLNILHRETNPESGLKTRK